MRGAALVLAGLLAGCGPSAQAPDAAPTETPSPAPEHLLGEYRVAAIDGDELGEGIALSITEGKVSFEPTCAGFVWQYAYRGGVLDIDRRQEKLQHPPPPPCLVPPQSEDKLRLASALDAVNRAARTPANGIELSGKGRSVLLFGQ